MKNLVLGIGSAVGGFILREAMNYFRIELMSIKGFLICLIVAIVYVTILSKVLDKLYS